MHNEMSTMSEAPDRATSDGIGSINFLRRFAAMMAGGTSAAQLQQCADVIEDLARRLSESGHRVQQAEAQSDAYRELCTTAEAAIHDLRNEIAMLEQRLEAQHTASELALAKSVEQRQDLSALMVQSLAERDDARAELGRRNAELDALSGCSVVPLAAMSAIRDQFRSIADQSETSGNIVAVTMAEIGSAMAEQAIAARCAAILDQDQMTHDIQSTPLC